MKKLIEVIKLVADKYMGKVDLILSDNFLTLEYLKEYGEESDVWKTVRIEEFEDKLKITPYPERIEKLIDVEEIEDIIEILEKQCNKQQHTQEEINYIREKYKQGTKIELIKMYDFQSVPPKTRGVVEFVDDLGTIHIKWQNGSTLGLVLGTDEFKIIGQETENTIINDDQDKIEELKISSRDEILEHFKDEFGGRLEEEKKNFSTMMNLYHEHIEQTFKMTEIHKLILNKIVEIENEFVGSLNDRQRELFNKWELYRDEIENYENEQSFIYGYCMDKELNLEKDSYNEANQDSCFI